MTTSIIRRNNGTVPAKPITIWADRLINENLNRMFQDDFWGFNGLEQSVTVPVNLLETDKTFELELVAPGLQKDDFKLNVSNNQLTISFEQKEENKQEVKEEGWLRKEYNMQSFTRSFTLDDTVDQNKIEAAYQNGILKVSIYKKEQAQRLSKIIQVK
jgi:HSP20 family protein